MPDLPRPSAKAQKLIDQINQRSAAPKIGERVKDAAEGSRGTPSILMEQVREYEPSVSHFVDPTSTLKGMPMVIGGKGTEKAQAIFQPAPRVEFTDQQVADLKRYLGITAGAAVVAGSLASLGGPTLVALARSLATKRAFQKFLGTKAGRDVLTSVVKRGPIKAPAKATEATLPQKVMQVGRVLKAKVTGTGPSKKVISQTGKASHVGVKVGKAIQKYGVPLAVGTALTATTASALKNMGIGSAAVKPIVEAAKVVAPVVAQTVVDAGNKTKIKVQVAPTATVNQDVSQLVNLVQRQQEATSQAVGVLAMAEPIASANYGGGFSDVTKSLLNSVTDSGRDEFTGPRVGMDVDLEYLGAGGGSGRPSSGEPPLVPSYCSVLVDQVLDGTLDPKDLPVECRPLLDWQNNV